MDIFVINTDKVNLVSEELLSKFSRRKYCNEKQRRIHQFSYLMLDRILENFYKLQNRELIYNDKPLLKAGGKCFSISHSGEYIVIAFSDLPCGIDIEKIKNRDYERISKKMNFHSGSLKDFYINWTRYEAEYKLDCRAESAYNFEIPSYIVTAVSGNSDETFDIYYNL